MMRMSAADRGDCKVAYSVALWLHDERAGRHVVTGEGLTAFAAGRYPEYVGQLFPDARRRFGLPALRAAVDDMLPAGCCRWGLEHVYARQQGVPWQPYSPARRVLFGGDPCPGCRRDMMNAFAARVHRAGTSAPVTVASTARRKPPNLTDPRTHRGCVKCYQQAAAQSSIRAGAVPATNQVMKDYVARGVAWHVEEHAANLPGAYSLTASGRLRVSTWLKAKPA